MLAPGGLGVSQLPSAPDDATISSLQGIEARKLETSIFPLGGLAASGTALYGEILVWDGAHWVDRNWVPGLGVGIPLRAGSTLTVSGLTLLIGAVNAAGDLTLGTTTTNTLTCTGITVLSGTVTMAAGLNTWGPLSLGGNLTASGSIGLLGTLQVYGAASLGANLTVSGSLGVGGGLQVYGPSRLVGNATLSGALGLLGAAQIYGPALLGSNLTVSGAVGLAATLQVYGATQLLGNVTASGALGLLGNAQVYGAAFLGATLTVTGSAGFAGPVQHFGPTSLVGNVTATGSVGVLGGLQVYGGTFLGTTLTVTGSVGLASSLQVYGPTSLVGNVTATGSVGLLGNLQTYGSAQVGGTVTVTGSLGIAGATQHFGPTSLVGNVTATGSVGVLGGLQVYGAVVHQTTTQLLGATNTGDLVANNLTASTLTVTGTALLSGGTTSYGPITVNALVGGRCLTLNADAAATIFITPKVGTNFSNYKVNNVLQFLTDSGQTGAWNAGVQNLHTGQAWLYNDGTDTVTLGVAGGITSVPSLLGVGGLFSAAASTLNSLTVTGSTKLVGASLLGDLTAGGTTCSTLVTTGTTRLLATTTITGSTVMTMVDSATGSIVPVLTLQHVLSSPLSGATGIGAALVIQGYDAGAKIQEYGQIQCFPNNLSSFGAAMAFKTWTANAQTEIMRIRNQQLWIEGDLLVGGGTAGTGAAGASRIGFFNATPTDRQTVTGSRGANAALASLLTGLATLGLITDSSS